MIDWGAYDKYTDWGAKTDPEMEALFKGRYFNRLAYKSVLYACKAALLCLYMDLTHKGTKIWWTIMFTWVWLAISELFQVKCTTPAPLY